MSKADVLNLVAALSNGMADPSTVEHYYDSVMFELGREDWSVEATIIPLTIGQLEVALDAAVSQPIVDLPELIYDDRALEEVPLRLLESIDPYWRDRRGSPRSYVIEDETRKTIALHPAPILNSNPNLGQTGEPLGLDYPTYNLLLFYSYAPVAPSGPPAYLELAIALRILAEEFNRESDHADMEFAAAAQALSDLCKGLVT